MSIYERNNKTDDVDESPERFVQMRLAGLPPAVESVACLVEATEEGSENVLLDDVCQRRGHLGWERNALGHLQKFGDEIERWECRGEIGENVEITASILEGKAGRFTGDEGFEKQQRWFCVVLHQ